MTRTERPILIAMAISAAALAAAFFFEFAMGFRPCQLCITQRWAHVLVLLAGFVHLLAAGIIRGRAGTPVRRRIGMATAGLGLAASFDVIGWAIFHAGVEWRFWPGPASCSGGTRLGALSGAELLDFSTPAAAVSCADPAWVFLGLSMASWNALIGAGLASLFLARLLRLTKTSKAVG